MKNFTLTSSTKEKLREAGVAVVYFFGSRANQNYFVFSDFDIGIVMEEKRLTEENAGKLYNTIYNIISDEIPDEPNGPKLDIALLQMANPVLSMKAIKEGKILFESNEKLRADFEEIMFKKYNDYSMLKREYEEANIRAFERI